MSIDIGKKLNIAMAIGTGAWTGAEQHVLYLADALAASGHQVHIVCRHNSPIEKYASGRYRTLALKMRNALDVISILQLSLYLRKNKIDILHSHHNKVGWIAMFAAKFCKNIPVLNTRHMLQIYGKNDRLHRWYYKQLSAIVCPSEAVRKSFLRYNPGVCKEKVYTVYNGIDTRAMLLGDGKLIRKELDIDKDIFLIGFVGRISADKGVRFLIEALPKLVTKKYHVLLVGSREHDYECILKEIINKLQIEKKVTFFGQTTRIPEVMNAIDVLVQPSTIMESFGQVSCEAMVCGKAVIATNNGALGEIVSNGKNGFLINPESSDEVATALNTLIGDRKLLLAIGKAAKTTIIDSFSRECMAREMESLYYKLIEKRKML
ncbi:MAG: glycosyltransferase family 4 protein [Bacillota bacterium]